MEIQQLKYAVALAKELHFHRAARKANVTQPTLSQQIKKLEDEIGTPLFERSPQNVKLTPQGHKFIPHAMAILDEISQSLREMKEESGKISGEIRVGVIPTICPYLMPQVYSRMRAEYPEVRLELFEETTSILLDQLKGGFIDFGILSLPIKDKGIASISLAEEDFYLAVTRKHPLAKKSSVNIGNIKNESLLILKEGHCFRDQALNYCKKSVRDTQIVFQGSSLTSVMKLVEAGEGITLVPSIAVNPKENPNIVFIPFSAPKPKRELGVIWRIYSPLDRTGRVFMDMIEQTLKDIL